MTTTDGMAAPDTRGRVMRSEARYYDLLAWLLTLGRERALRERLVELARLKPGDAVLDVGCGTGTLAIAAKRRVGAAGTVHGIDASPEMIDRAKRKAAKAGSDVTFRTAVVEALPFPDAHFDVVVSTLMLHHLPGPARRQCAREMRRVLAPGGRVLAVDFATPEKKRTGLLGHLHRHGHLALRDIAALLSEAGLTVVDSGAVGVSDLHFVLATMPDPRDESAPDLPEPAPRALAPLPAPRWVLPALGIALVAGHGMVLRVASSRPALSAAAGASVAGFWVIHHAGLAGVSHTVLRRRRSRR